MKVVDLINYRYHNQHIDKAKFKKPEELVKWMGAIQAQDYYGSLWGIGLRVSNSTISSVKKAIACKKIIRTWPMRGTLHFVHSEHAKWMLDLLTPRVVKKRLSRYKELGLNDKIFEKSKKIFIKSLEGNKQLTRNELYEALAKGGVNTEGQRGYHILCHLAQKAVICFGAKKGNQHTFALFDEWVPRSRALSRDKALEQIARVYFTSHGPATLQDFMWWSGLTSTDARIGIERAQGINNLDANGRTYYMSINMINKIDFEAQLLPPYDEYFISYKDRSAIIDSDTVNKINLALTNSPILIDGKVCGIWKRTLKKNKVTIKLNVFKPIKKSTKDSLLKASEEYGRFLETKADALIAEP